MATSRKKHLIEIIPEENAEFEELHSLGDESLGDKQSEDTG